MGEPVRRCLAPVSAGFVGQFVEADERPLDVGDVRFELFEPCGAFHRPRIVPIIVLAATNSIGTLAVCFLVAAVIVSPWALRAVRSAKAANLAARELSGDADAGDLEAADAQAASDDPPFRRDSLEAVLTRLDALARPSDAATVRLDVPIAPTYDGRPIPPEVARQILTEAVNQGGWQLADVETEGTIEWWTLAPHPPR